MERNHCCDLLAQAIIGDTDHRNLTNVGVLVEDLFDLTRVDVVTTADDQVLLTVDDPNETGFILLADVARQEPIPAHDLGRCLGATPITLHDDRALDGDFAGFSMWNRVAVSIHDADFQTSQSRPDATFLAITAGSVECGSACCFAESISVKDRAPEALTEGIGNSERQSRSARGGKSQVD